MGRGTEKSRSGFDPLAYPQAYQAVGKGVHLWESNGDAPAPISTLGEKEAAERVADVRTAATARPFRKMVSGFWKEQLTEAEKHVAQKTFRADFKRTYPSERYPVLTSKPNISPSSFFSPMAHMLNVIRCSA